MTAPGSERGNEPASSGPDIGRVSIARAIGRVSIDPATGVASIDPATAMAESFGLGTVPEFFGPATVSEFIGPVTAMADSFAPDTVHHRSCRVLAEATARRSHAAGPGYTVVARALSWRLRSAPADRHGLSWRKAVSPRFSAPPCRSPA